MTALALPGKSPACDPRPAQARRKRRRPNRLSPFRGHTLSRGNGGRTEAEQQEIDQRVKAYMKSIEQTGEIDWQRRGA